MWTGSATSCPPWSSATPAAEPGAQQQPWPPGCFEGSRRPAEARPCTSEKEVETSDCEQQRNSATYMLVTDAATNTHSLRRPLEVGTAEAQPPDDILYHGVALDAVREQVSKHRGAHLGRVHMLQQQQGGSWKARVCAFGRDRPIPPPLTCQIPIFSICLSSIAVAGCCWPWTAKHR